MLTVLESVEAEHERPPCRRWPTWRRAPIALLFVYFAAISARWGAKPSGPTFVDRDQLAGRERARARRRQQQQPQP